MDVKYDKLPVLEQIAFLEGVAARDEGDHCTTNPYLEDSREFKLWITGWYLQEMQEYQSNGAKERAPEQSVYRTEGGAGKKSQKAPCPECGKTTSITASGTYRYHKNDGQKCDGSGQEWKGE